MNQSAPTLGLCFSSRQLYYAVQHQEQVDQLTHIGSIDFNFNLLKAVVQREGDNYENVGQVIGDLVEKFSVEHIRFLTNPYYECWTIFPKLVYDKADEREAHLNILMKGVDRQQIEPYWFSLSNQNFKLLVVRNNNILDNFRQIADSSSTIEFFSDFEIGQRWIQHTDQRGSFLTISRHNNLISIASFLLGKLRGVTYIKFEDINDLPYLWLQQAEHSTWMKGLHEYIYVYGETPEQLITALEPYLDEAAEVVLMNSLERMQVEADEKTYSFELSQAFPAVLLALDLY